MTLSLFRIVLSLGLVLTAWSAELPLPQRPDEGVISQTLTVDQSHPQATDTNDGSNPSLPFKTIAAALKKAATQNTIITIEPGTYREYLHIQEGRNLIVLQAAKPNTVTLSGSTLYTDWQADGATYVHPWQHAWGLGTENAWWGSTSYQRRREMVFIDGTPLTQICLEDGEPVAADQLKPGQFTIQDTTANQPGSIRIRPADGVHIQQARIEVGELGHDPAFINASRPLILVENHTNVVLRNLTVQHVVNYIKFGPAVSFMGGYPGQPNLLPSHVLVDNCLITWNNGIGLEVSNYREVTVRNSQFTFNGERGAGSVQVGTENEHDIGTVVAARNFRYENCNFDHNNWRMAGIWGEMNDSAGYKMFGHNIDSYTFYKCTFNNNLANGFWQDYGGSNVVLDHCIIADNAGGESGGYGILHEMTRGPFTLSHSIVRNNSNSGFISSGSPNVTLTDSFLYYNAHGIKYNGQSLYGHEIKINSDTGRDSADFHFGLTGWNITNCTLASISGSMSGSVGKGSIFVVAGPDFPNGLAPSIEFATQLTSDYNIYSKDPNEKDYYPGDNILYALDAASTHPNVNLATWQQQANAHGHQDANSTFSYPADLTAAEKLTADIEAP